MIFYVYVHVCIQVYSNQFFVVGLSAAAQTPNLLFSCTFPLRCAGIFVMCVRCGCEYMCTDMCVVCTCIYLLLPIKKRAIYVCISRYCVSTCIHINRISMLIAIVCCIALFFLLMENHHMEEEILTGVQKRIIITLSKRQQWCRWSCTELKEENGS